VRRAPQSAEAPSTATDRRRPQPTLGPLPPFSPRNKKSHSALAAAGKSVLLLDAHDYYGGAWASVNGRAFARLLHGGSGGGGCGGGNSAAGDHHGPATTTAVPLTSHALPPLRATGVTTWRRRQREETEPAAGGEIKQQQQQQQQQQLLPPLLESCRAVDLAPRALYQGEPLVDGLVAARAHPYVDFKLVEGSYVLDAGHLGEGGGAGNTEGEGATTRGAVAPPPLPPRPRLSRPLLRIPASKAQIFADRSLAPREKRALMRFLAAGLEAASSAAAGQEQQQQQEEQEEGGEPPRAAAASAAAAAAAAAQGAFPAAAARQKEASTLAAALARRDVPLARVLGDEGLPPRVRDFVLYGIAMESRVGGGGGGGGSSSQAAAGAAATPATDTTHLLSAADGRDALALYAASLGRFAAPEAAPPPAAPGSGGAAAAALLAPPPPPPASAFMAAAHGAGSLVEAFVRHAAVRGALTVLRRPVGALLLAEEQEEEGGGGGAEEQGTTTTMTTTATATTATATARGRQELAAAASRRRVVVAGVRLAGAGQRLSAPAVVGARASLLPVSGKGDTATGVLARCVAVLDGPLRPEAGGGSSSGGRAGDALALLVAPPCAAATAPPAVVRGLMLGPAAQAGPAPSLLAQPGGPFYLLYLVADVSHLVLVAGGGGGPLAATAGGGSPSSGGDDSQRAPAAAAAAAAPASSAEAVLAPVLEQLATRGGGGASLEASESVRPRVLEAVFYTQWPSGGEEGGGSGEAAALPTAAPPEGLVVCPGPDEVAPGVAGYVKAWAAAERLYRRHFPGLAWLGEEGKQQQEDGTAARCEEAEEEQEGGGGTRSAGAAGRDGDARARGGAEDAASDPPTEGMDAIDELSSALAALGELDKA
jgi:hypothetical protein